MKKLLVVAIAATLFGGCSTTNTAKRIEADDKVGGIDVIKLEHLNNKEMIPVWYLDPGIDNETVVYAAATAVSNDMEYATHKAMHQAQVKLAQKIASNLTAKFKFFKSDTEQKDSLVSVNAFENVPVTNYRVVNKAIFKEGTSYRAYINLSYAITDVGFAPQTQTLNEADRAFNDINQ